MKSPFTKFGLPALLGFIAVLPFMFLELVNRQNHPAALPILLFGILWLLATVFFLLLIPIVRSISAGKNLTAHPIAIVASVVCLFITAA